MYLNWPPCLGNRIGTTCVSLAAPWATSPVVYTRQYNLMYLFVCCILRPPTTPWYRHYCQDWSMKACPPPLRILDRKKLALWVPLTEDQSSFASSPKGPALLAGKRLRPGVLRGVAAAIRLPISVSAVLSLCWGNVAGWERGGGINGRYRSTECPRHRHFQQLVQRFSHICLCGNVGGGGGGALANLSGPTRPPTTKRLSARTKKGNILLKGAQNYRAILGTQTSKTPRGCGSFATNQWPASIPGIQLYCDKVCHYQFVKALV